MKILIISRGYPLPNAPLNGIFEFDQAKALKDYGHEVLFVSIDLRSIRRKRKLGRYFTKKEGVDIVNFSLPIGKSSHTFLSYIGKKALNNLYKNIVIKWGKPDIIHAHFAIMGNIAIPLKESHNIPLVITEHNSEANTLKISLPIYNLGKKTYYKADALLAVSSALAKNISNHWKISCHVIPNIVDTTLFKYIPKTNQKEFVFLSVGNLNHNKGFDLLINAFTEAKFEKNVRLKIIGNGALYNMLHDQIKSLEMSNQIELLGYLHRGEIADLMKQSDVFVLASRGETFGVVYIEAMAAGLPVITTACGGPEDFVNSQNGILIPPEDEKSLTEALVKIYNNIESFDPLFISESTKLKFSPQHIAEQLTNVYAEALQTKNKL